MGKLLRFNLFNFLRYKLKQPIPVPVVPVVPVQVPVPQIKIKPEIQKPKQPKTPNKQIKQKPFQKLNIPKISQGKPQISIPSPTDQKNKKKHEIIEKKQSNNDNLLSQAFNVREIFPIANKYYRLGVPNPEQLQYFQTLQGLLSTKKLFNDKNNPFSHLGSYKYANEFFKGLNYEIFMMAASVIHRQKSRIGLARQIQPKDIIQGQLGDCYLLSSIASIISFYPEVVFDKILFSVNQSHYYVVKLFIDGEWQFIVTDDQFPCQYGKPIFAKPHGNQIWVMLLEKCWAKIYGSYKSIESGTPTEGFRALSGAPSEYFQVQKQQDKIKIRNSLQQAYEKRYVSTASSSKYLESLSELQQNEIGLISHHAYSFLKMLNINGETIVKMRNPWGKTVWKGEWSFQSKKWTKQLRQKYNYVYLPDDGSFYMGWDNFLKYFSCFVICRIDPTFLHSSLRLNNVKPFKPTYLRLVVNEEGTYNISIYQESKRKNTNIKNYQYNSVRLILVKDNDDHYQYINSMNKQASHSTSFQTFLKKGIYLATVQVQQYKQKMYPLVFCSYGVQKIQVQEIDSFIAPLFKQFLIKSYSQKFKGKIKKYEKIGLPEAYNEVEISIERGIGFIRMKNPTNKSFKTVLSMPSCQGLRVIDPYKLPLQFDMKPKAEYIVGLWVSSKGYSYESSESMTY